MAKNQSKKPNPPKQQNNPPKQQSKLNQQDKQSNQSNKSIDQQIVEHIKQLNSFQHYEIRQLVEHAEQLGPHLKQKNLETNQIRKFLDAINRVKTRLAQNADQKELFKSIEPEIVLLKPKLAYAAARQPAVEPLNNVISTAIDRVHSIKDFNYLVQFVEAIVAYHKAEGGK